MKKAKRKEISLAPVKESPYRLYILMRVDLPSMNVGKAMAQAAHAANALVWYHGKKSTVKEWLDQANGFGTTITLAATKEQISTIIPQAIGRLGTAGFVYDPTYPYIVNSEINSLLDHAYWDTSDPILKENGQVVCFRNELTCGYILLNAEDPIKDELVGELSLHP